MRISGNLRLVPMHLSEYVFSTGRRFFTLEEPTLDLPEEWAVSCRINDITFHNSEEVMGDVLVVRDSGASGHFHPVNLGE